MPNRIIKDSIRTSRSVNAMSDFQFRLWAYLITYVDDFGRGSADPELLKGFVFPRRKGVTEDTIKKTLAELATIGSVILYEVDGEPYLCFPNWSEHQSIRNKVSKYPAPDDGIIQIASSCMQMKSNECSCNQTYADECKCYRNPIQSESNPNPESESKAREARSAEFEQFWAVYPRKVGKKDALKAFKKAKTSVDVLIAAIERQKQSQQWIKDDGQYIPNPATWLNQGRWEDEVTPPRDIHVKPGYGVQKHNDHLGDFEREAVARMLGKELER